MIRYQFNLLLIAVHLLCVFSYTAQASGAAQASGTDAGNIANRQAAQTDNTIDVNALFLSAIDSNTEENKMLNKHFHEVSNQLKRYQTIRSKFTQNKTIKVLKRPLRSSGSIIFNTQQGLFWHTDTPIDTALLISDTGITETINGKSRKLFDAAQHRTSKELFTIFSALFSGNTATLANYFELYFSGNAQQWAIGLMPKNSLLKKAINKIVVSGATHVQAIQVWESGGDHTAIDFRETSSQPAILTREEAEYFAR